jgi:hypothetical protein
VSFDNSRFTFNPWRDFAGVVMEQGRVQTDADWNEWLAEISRRIQAGTLDIMGRAVYPPTTPYAFQIEITSTGGTPSISIGLGRMYVDGLLAENHGTHKNATWDPALAELSGTPQPRPSTSKNAIDYNAQPYYPGAPKDVLSKSTTFLAYLDVWTRPVTWLQDPHLIDKAIGVDTSGRLQTVWQVRLMDATGKKWSCATPESEIPYPPDSAGRLSTDVVPNPSAGPCCLTTGTGYTGVENQFYRVEIHQGGAPNATGGIGKSTGATFKWSRENASVETGVTFIAAATNTLGKAAAQLTVLSLGRDQVLGFMPGNWIEMIDETLELSGKPGELYQIDSIDFAGKTITLTTPLASPGAFGTGTPPAKSFTRIRRWDQAGTVYEEDGVTVWCDLGASGTGAIPVPESGTTLILENGIVVTFSLNPASGVFNVADFWTFAARTADGSVEKLDAAPPRGIHHHYTKLSVVTLPNSAPDCRTPWNPSNEADCGCCTCTVGDGQESIGKYTSINTAIASLPANGGEVCILPGRYFEHVVIENTDVIIRGCGWQTRLASPSYEQQQQAAPQASTQATQPVAASGLPAVITVLGSHHVQLRSFAVEAAEGEVGILLDHAAAEPPPPVKVQIEAVQKKRVQDASASNSDITIEDLVVVASTCPAIAGVDVKLLKIAGNRIAMENTLGQYPAICVSGRQMRIEHNWVGLTNAADANDRLPASVVTDLAPPPVQIQARKETQMQEGQALATAGNAIVAAGGIQIGGPSQDVLVVENEIEGGSGNGITLGRFAILDANGDDSGKLTGVVVTVPDKCSTTRTLQLPGSIGSGSSEQALVAGGLLADILIARNRIRNMGLCGIGPVGFFNLFETAEVISLRNLAISANVISRTLLSPIEESKFARATFGYGAICVPDAQNLDVSDNVVTDFGVTPGAEVCGIFILNAQTAVISRNRVVETRDWSLATASSQESASVLRGGILALTVTPAAFAAPNAASAQWWQPSSTSSLSSSDTQAAAGNLQAEAVLAPPVYEPGLPALRVEHNVVRVPLGTALLVLGFGPFSVVNNHFSSGGTVTLEGTAAVTTVEIMNLGTFIDFVNVSGGYSGYTEGRTYAANIGKGGVASSPNGSVLFANNICQLETRVSGQKGFASVMVASHDHVNFEGNQCWVDGSALSVALDVLVVGATLQVNGNRFQEAFGSVLASGITLGGVNITCQNISTVCLFANAANAAYLKSTNNVVIVPLNCAQQGGETLTPAGG